MDESQLRELELKWRRDQLSKKLAGVGEQDEEAADGGETEPMSREQIKARLLLRKGDKKS